jgi:hypothetical protein
MSLSTKQSALFGLALVIGAGALCGCGKIGVLQQPAPLFGERAREDYMAKERARAAQDPNAAQTPTPAADQPDPNADDAPRTARDVKDPGQQNVPASQQPIEGVPDLLGPTPSMKPPGA